MVSADGQASSFWSLVGGLASLLLLVSPFLTWLNVQWLGGLPAQAITTAGSAQTGIMADGTGSIVTLSGCAGLCVILAGLTLRRARTVALAAVPGGIALVACCVFAIRVHSGDREIGGVTYLPTGLGSVTLSLGVGWYLTLAGALILLGTGIAIATQARPSTPTVPLTPPTPMPPAAP
jgi:hypothetical protein